MHKQSQQIALSELRTGYGLFSVQIALLIASPLLRISRPTKLSPHPITMFAARIDNFAGDDHAYAGYLLEVLTRTLPGCIRRLEEQVKEARRDSNPPRTRVVLEFSDSTTPTDLQVETSNTTKQPPLWVGRTASFFKDLPKTEGQWFRKRESAGLSSAKDILLTARCLATGRLGSIPFTDHTKRSDLQDSLITFAHNIGEALAGAKLYSHISHFLSLIFVATCCVAKKKGHPGELVDEAQRKLIEASRGKCNKGFQQLINDRASMTWLLQEMQRQFRRGLRQRAFELFFLSTSRSNLPRTSRPEAYLSYRRQRVVLLWSMP